MNFPIPDQAARDLIASELDSNLLVEASAGSGKTHELTRRMVALIASGKSRADEMAAMTFTKRAAAELRQRFQIGLERAFSEEADEARRRRLSEALARRDAGFIGTIHSFCAEILRERPAEASLPPGFRELEDQDPALVLLRDRVWRGWLEKLESGDHESAEALLSAGVEPSELKAAYEAICEFPDVDFPFDRSSPRPDLRPAVDSVGAFLEESISRLDSQKGVKTVLDRLMAVSRRREALEPSDPASCAEWLAAFLSEIKDSESQRRNVAAGEIEAAAIRMRDEIVRPAVVAWREFVYPRALAIIVPAATEFRLRRRQAGLVSFTDLLVLSRDLLRDSPTVRRDLGARFRFLLVDEFQDTDPIQAEVLCYLSGEDLREKDWTRLVPRPGSLFVVGDPKQAIYRFRRADPATYVLFRDLIARTGGRIVTLSASFRSLPSLCEWANSVFSTVFRRDSESFQAEWAPVSATRAGEHEPAGVFRLLTATHGLEAATVTAQQEAERVADFVASTGDSFVPSDFLLLARKRGRLALYQRALERRGIPGEIQTGTERGDPEEVPASLVGFASLLEAVASPSNPVPIVGFLRSVLCGVSDDALFRFHELGGKFDPFAKLPSGADASLSEGFEVLRKCIRESRNHPPGAAVAAIAKSAGLFAACAAATEAESAAATANRVLTFARRASAEGDAFRVVASELAELIRSAEIVATTISPGADAVRLMTIHSAKGLEARAVFLIDPAGNGKPKSASHHISRGPAPAGYLPIVRKRPGDRRSPGEVIAQPPGWNEMEEAERRLDEGEIDRLRYVAATRARDLLVVGINRHSTASAPAAAPRGLWAPMDAHLGRDLPVPAVSPSPRAQGPVDLLASHAESSESVERFRESLRRPTYRVETVTHRVEAEAPVRPDFESGRGKAWGRVLHRMLEAIMRDENTDVRGLAGFLLHEADAPIGEVEEVVAICDAVVRSELWRRALSAEKCLVEVPFEILSESPPDGGPPLLLKGAIDLAFLESGVWHIVDYKSDVVGDRLESLVRRYSRQVKIYRDQWQGITGTPAKAGLYFIDTKAARWLD